MISSVLLVSGDEDADFDDDVVSDDFDDSAMDHDDISDDDDDNVIPETSESVKPLERVSFTWLSLVGVLD